MADKEFATRMHDLINAGETFVLATIIRTSQSTLGKPGFKAIVKDDRIDSGTLGGACPDGVIVAYSKKVLDAGIPRTIVVHLEEAGKGTELKLSNSEDEVFVETFCGGTMEVFLEPYKPEQRLILVGNGGSDPILDGLVVLGKMAAFEVWVIDNTASAMEKADRVVTDNFDDLKSFEWRTDDFVVLLTKGNRDVSVLRNLSTSGVKYVGLLASGTRVARDKEELSKLGVTDDFLGAIHWPIGLKIGAKLPPEIALSIMAEIVSVRRGVSAVEVNPAATPEDK